MPEPTSTSFIPKRNPIKNVRNPIARPVFVGTLLIRAFFFAVLIATVVIFVYNNRLNAQLDTEITNLNTVIATFSEVDMQKVMDTDIRLTQATNRVQHAASISAILEAIEAATIQTVQIERFELERTDDTQFNLSAKMRTGSFDSVIFQRSVLERSDKLAVTGIEELIINNTAGQTGSDNQISHVNFKADLSVTTDMIPPRVVNDPRFQNDTVPVQEQTTSNTELNFEEEPVNQDDI